MATKKKTDPKERVLLVKTVKGEFKVTIPGDAKITFGPAFRNHKESGFNAVAEYALRIYQGSKENLLAVFTEVRGFQDINIPIERKVVSEAGKTLWRSDEGGYSVTSSVKKKETFVAGLLNPGSKEEGPF